MSLERDIFQCPDLGLLGNSNLVESMDSLVNAAISGSPTRHVNVVFLERGRGDCLQVDQMVLVQGSLERAQRRFGLRPTRRVVRRGRAPLAVVRRRIACQASFRPLNLDIHGEGGLKVGTNVTLAS